MPLVFVHGVNVRKGDDYERSVSRRNDLFRRFALKQVVDTWRDFPILNPYWGGDAAKFLWNNASLPTGKEDVLGGVAEDVALFLAETDSFPSRPDCAVLTVAQRRGLSPALDLLWSNTSHAGREEYSPALAGLAEQAHSYAESNPRPVWLGTVENDQEFITALKGALAEVSTPQFLPASSIAMTVTKAEVLGGADIWETLREAAGRIATAVPAAMSATLLAFARNSLHRNIATFLGDVLVYIKQRDEKGPSSPIIRQVTESLKAADKLREKRNEPTVIVAHSMGGNIMYDILTSYLTDCPVDMLVTVGSQPSLFAELDLFQYKQQVTNPQVDRAPAPPSVKTWLNVFDSNDILSFAGKRVFAGVKDFEYSTGRDVFHAHTSYFNRPSFQQRLGDHIKSVWPR